MLTNNDDYMVRVELEDFDGNKRSVCNFINLAPDVRRFKRCLLRASPNKLHQLMREIHPNDFLNSDTRSIRTSKFTQKRNITNWRSTGTKVTLATR